ncbi:hypothetical protein BSL78_20222 [Apostichopus japonicus]|uniref:NACHT domain-containing protein n=1 Tax=Stichopus japonicus TaxID=307972 RepID=A0A2G8K4P9_STIJA|nr:hypothetical protein BSL78_20222 [Apostichopus japonicus]
MRQIRDTYAGFYNAVKPLPHIPTVMVNVNDIFVDGRIQLLTSQRTWEDLQSHAHIITDKRIGKRCLIEGPPGSGKSTLSLQFAYEWSQGKLNERADIVLLFQLRKLKNIFTLQQAVKQLLLPKDSTTKEDEIEFFLKEFNSIVIIFDAYDEMPDQTENDFIADILKNLSHREFKVIVTTRSSCLPEEFSPSTSRIYLDGFNDKDRDTYIKKAVKDEEDVVKTQIQRQLETAQKEDPIFRDIFKCPFFFVVVVHNWKENKGRYHRSVTYTVNLLLLSLVHHMNNKHYSTIITEIPYSNGLNETVFKSIIQKEKKIWTVDEFSKQFGENLLSVYKQLGILEDIEPRRSYHDEQSLDGTVIDDSFTGVVNVTIRRNVMREWFAAKYIVNKIVSLTDKDLITFSKILAEKAQERQFHNIFRFACGINVVALEKILHIILQSKDNQKLAVSCIMEIKSNAFTERVRSLRKICKHSIEIAIKDNLYTQRKLRDFLELVADYSNHKVIVPSVILMNSYHSVDDSHENILLKSSLNIPSSIATEELCIVNSGAEFTVGEIKQLIDYASFVKSLKTLSLERCLVPLQLKEVTATYKNLHRYIEVIWRPEGRSKRFPWYRLNSVGHWEDSTHEEITDQDYKRVADSIKEITGNHMS